MIQNERQYQITRTKLREFKQELANINPQDPAIHPRQIIGWTNSLNFTIDKLKQEIAGSPELTVIIFSNWRNELTNDYESYQN
jgi:hypothetical protein